MVLISVNNLKIEVVNPRISNLLWVLNRCSKVNQLFISFVYLEKRNYL